MSQMISINRLIILTVEKIQHVTTFKTGTKIPDFHFISKRTMPKLSAYETELRQYLSSAQYICHADKISVVGLIKTRFYLGCKVAVLNVRKLLKLRNDRGHYAENAQIAVRE